ncbi:uncharacterized protein TrAtP1_008687 [Trichoderma atroviride]|uniref:uncharacterized protein n=1 Tax=Hypocrea atroviridis TaxID=63577 RepID=UPI0033172173|nr:hypothetical protein TrAtP1_008687 [Trichoderma atroviride]
MSSRQAAASQSVSTTVAISAEVQNSLGWIPRRWGAGTTITTDAFLDLSPLRHRVFVNASQFASAADDRGSLQGTLATRLLQSL